MDKEERLKQLEEQMEELMRWHEEMRNLFRTKEPSDKFLRRQT